MPSIFGKMSVGVNDVGKEHGVLSFSEALAGDLPTFEKGEVDR